MAVSINLNMNKNKFSDKQIKVGGTTGVEPIFIEYKDNDYDLHVNSDSKALKDKNGYLVIVRLFSSNNKLPRFIFRWDHNASAVDVDIFFGDKNCNHLWKEKGNGYEGHWTKLTNDEKREYSVSIKIPERKIFEGIIRVGLLTELNLHDKVTIGESVDVKII